MNKEFNTWWHNGEAPNNNPYELDSAAYWAWEGWCAGVAAEREACAKVAEQTVCDTHLPTGVKIYGTRAAKAIRARGQDPMPLFDDWGKDWK